MRIDGVGTARPRYDAPQSEAADFHATLSGFDAGRRRTLKALYRRSGVGRRASVLLERADGSIAERQDFYHPVRDEGDPGPSTADRMARYERWAPVLAREAASSALADSGRAPTSVTHLVTVSCTGFVSPGVDARLVEDLGLECGVERTHVGFMGCHAALNGIRAARGYAEADPRNVVLVCAVELCSLHFTYGWDPEATVANALFADGAGAVVCSGSEPARSRPPWHVGATGTLLVEDSREDMTWRIGDHGFRMTLSARVPDLIRGRLGHWLRDWLGQHGLRPEDVATWAAHPGGPRILTAVEDALALDRGSTAVSREVLEAHGNMSSATIIFILQRLRARGAALPCVAIAFGPGLVFEAVLFV